MHRCIVVMAVLLSACRLMEEPTQQVKSALVSDDIVFDAQDLSKTAVMRCTNNGCGEKTPLFYALHQVTLSDEEIAGVLQFDNLHVSFEADNKHYTCLRASVPLGRMTLLWRADDDKHCYEQDKAKDYVQQFAAACIKEGEWQLVPEVGLKKFACKKESITISSDCFVAGNTGTCGTSNWPANIKEIHVKVGTKASTTPSENEKSEITAETKLKDVKIMAEWEWSGGQTVVCSGTDEEKRTFRGVSSAKQDVSKDYHAEGKINDFLIGFGCGGDSPVLSYGDESHVEHEGPLGICVATSVDDLTESLSACTTQRYYIKITFEAK